LTRINIYHIDLFLSLSQKSVYKARCESWFSCVDYTINKNASLVPHLLNYRTNASSPAFIHIEYALLFIDLSAEILNVEEIWCNQELLLRLSILLKFLDCYDWGL
jgi:hypothetical protein